MRKYYLSALISLVYIPIVTIGGELWKPLKDFFKNIFWHHWLGKGVVLVILFCASVGLFHKILAKDNEDRDEWYLKSILLISLFGAFSIFAFFTYEFFKHL